MTVIDYDLWARIDRVLHECDARQLPPLTAAFDQAGTVEHLVVLDEARRIVHPAVIPVDEAVRQLEPVRATFALPEPTGRLRWPWRRR